jgi:hypothetical protein
LELILRQALRPPAEAVTLELLDHLTQPLAFGARPAASP